MTESTDIPTTQSLVEKIGQEEEKEQEKEKKESKAFAMAMVSLSCFFVLSFFLVPIFVVSNLSYLASKEQQQLVSAQGYFDLSEISLEKTVPLLLSGAWLSYEGLFLEEAQVDSTQWQGDGSVTSLPIHTLRDSLGTCTYQSFVGLTLEEGRQSPVVLALRFLSDEVNIYHNGIKLAPYQMEISGIGNDQGVTLFSLEDHYDPSRDYQEILISTNQSEDATDLFGRAVMISTSGNLVYYENTLEILEFFFMGLCYCMMVVGFIYLIIRPSRSVLSLVNLFDTVLMSYVVYQHTNVSANIGETFSMLQLTDLQMQGASLFFLCATGAIGNDLARATFPTEKRMHPLLEHPFNLFFLFLAVVFAVNPLIYDGLGYPLVMFLFVVESTVILWRMGTYRKTVGLSKYMTFQVLKTLFILGVVAVDILFVPHVLDASTFIACLYSMFFIVHLFVRAYEYALPEKTLAEVNRNLEATIAERTKELVEINKALTELSIRDSMTKLYNRLHFEAVLEQSVHLVEEDVTGEKNLYLCLFDLDNFKQINDRFGHNVGDDQLKDVARTLTELLPPEVMFARIGGEEFTLLFEGGREEEVLSWVERARKAVETLAKQEGRTTGSFGVCKYQKGMGRKDFFVTADDCLYHSKEHGKNCITYNVSGENLLKTSH